jgi:hypothetical protein
MAQEKTVQTKHLGDNRYRDLQAYYEKGSINYWDYSNKPKGIYFASHCYTKSGGTRSWSTGQKGDGYLLIVPLDRYRPTALRKLQAAIKDHADHIHDLIERGEVNELHAFLKSECGVVDADVKATAEASKADDILSKVLA